MPALPVSLLVGRYWLGSYHPAPERRQWTPGDAGTSIKLQPLHATLLTKEEEGADAEVRSEGECNLPTNLLSIVFNQATKGGNFGRKQKGG